MMAKVLHVFKEVEIPERVEVQIEDMRIRVTGPKGTIEKDLSHIRGVDVKVVGNKVIVETYLANRKKKALVGTVAAHIRNMIKGVTKGYRYKLKIVYSHFPVNVKVEGDKVLIENFIGERAPRIAKIFGNVTVRVEGEDVIVEGIDVEEVSQTAANIELATRIKKYDPRVFMDGIYIYEKE